MSTTHLDGSPDLELASEMKAFQQRIVTLNLKVKEDRIAGEAALRRLLPIALNDSGQSIRVAKLLLGCYNGYRFPFDLTNLRSLDYTIMNDCLAVLRMDANCYQEVHCYFENGGRIFEQLADDLGLNAGSES